MSQFISRLTAHNHNALRSRPSRNLLDTRPAHPGKYALPFSYTTTIIDSMSLLMIKVYITASVFRVPVSVERKYHYWLLIASLMYWRSIARLEAFFSFACYNGPSYVPQENFLRYCIHPILLCAVFVFSGRKTYFLLPLCILCEGPGKDSSEEKHSYLEKRLGSHEMI